jgi:hypothetical protein
VPSLDHAGLSLAIAGRQPAARVHPSGTAGSRAGRTTHALVREGRDVRLVRRLFHERLA